MDAVRHLKEGACVEVELLAPGAGCQAEQGRGRPDPLVGAGQSVECGVPHVLYDASVDSGGGLHQGRLKVEQAPKVVVCLGDLRGSVWLPGPYLGADEAHGGGLLLPGPTSQWQMKRRTIDEQGHGRTTRQTRAQASARLEHRAQAA